MNTTKTQKYSIEQVMEIISILTPEEQVKLWQWLGEEINVSQQPWLKSAGIFQDDPHFEDVKHYINEYRQEIADIEESVS